MTEHSQGKIHLNDNQRRHYEVLFARLEQSLDQIERAAQGKAPASMLTMPVGDLPARFVAEAPPMIGTVRAWLADMIAVLGLRAREGSQRRTVQALITSEMVGLENSRASHLRGYGPVDASVGEHLDPALARIHGALAQLRALLRDPE